MSERFSRQSFLGGGAETRINDAVFGVAGLGGGGSHIVQHLAHIGCRQYVLFDADKVEESNLNRLVGATLDDAKHRVPKVKVASRTIRALVSDAKIEPHESRWQDNADRLRRCDLVFGCVDGFSERDQLEAACRRFLIPYIDIGLDVNIVGDEPPLMGGQVILSMPGEACMRCLGFITEKNLAAEETRYGDAGPRPQVVWANGLLASAAVGIAIELVTNWTRRAHAPMYLEYNGNAPILRDHPRLVHRDPAAECPHYLTGEVGEVRFDSL
jgi:hypothetical protein